MGGNALQKTADRLTVKAFNALSDRVCGVLEQHGFTCAVPHYIRSKSSFGDLDIIIGNGEQADLTEVFSDLGITNIVSTKNNPTISTGINVGDHFYQVDFMRVEPAEFNFAHHYYSMNDLGNLIGSVARAAGFKLGHKGLTFAIKDPSNSTRHLGDVTVTTSWWAALYFLGYDNNDYREGVQHGFHTYDDVFRYASSSYRFNKSLFVLANLNHSRRTRDIKRPTYKAYLDWLELQDDLPAFEWTNETQQSMLAGALVWFPQFSVNLDTVLNRDKAHRAASRKINGDTVHELTGLTGKSLGYAMKKIADAFKDKEDMLSWTAAASEEEIATLIRSSTSGSSPPLNY